MKRLTLFLFILVKMSFSQEMPDLLLNTPEAPGLIKVIEYPMNYSSGLLNISIPLHSVSVDNLTIPIKQKNLKRQKREF